MQFQSMLSILLASVERVAALGLVGASAAGLLDVAKKWPVSLSTVPTAFFAALLPAASHVDAASSGKERLRNLGDLYLRGSRYSNICTAAFVAALTLWAGPILRVWLGPALPMGDMLVPLFVVFSLAMHMHMLTGAGTSIFGEWPGLRGVHLFDSQPGASGGHIAGSSLDRRTLDPVRHRSGSLPGHCRFGMRVDGQSALGAGSSAGKLHAGCDCAWLAALPQSQAHWHGPLQGW